jgi:hypothetical protein
MGRSDRAAGDAMSPRAADLGARQRADGDPEELVAWCLATTDVIAFQVALRRVSPERWPSIQARVAESLASVERPTGPVVRGNAADRARRGRSAARLMKLQMLDQEDASRTSRDPLARALLKVARQGPRPDEHSEVAETAS